MTAVLRVRHPGVLTTFQDAGRGDGVGYGVPESGAFDRRSWSEANRLVGNNPAVGRGGPAALEILLGGLSIQAEVDTWVGIAGAHALGSIQLQAGEQLTLDRTKRGIRTYLAIPGGFAAEAVLGSRSWDTTSELGPVPIIADDVLAAADPAVNTARLRERPGEPLNIGALFTLNMWPGPQSAVLAEADLSLAETQWRVMPDSSRAGIRLGTDSAAPHAHGSLPSIPTMPGAVQLLPNGQLVVFGPDAPVTGGYPVVGVISRIELDQLGQARPGQGVTFRLRQPYGLPLPR